MTVNAIAPGYIDTDMVAAVPEEVLGKIVAKIPVEPPRPRRRDCARSCLSWSTRMRGFITGSTLSINGGQHMY